MPIQKYSVNQHPIQTILSVNSEIEKLIEEIKGYVLDVYCELGTG